MSERKAVIKNADMSEDMQQDAIDSATQVRTLPEKKNGGPHRWRKKARRGMGRGVAEVAGRKTSHTAMAR